MSLQLNEPVGDIAALDIYTTRPDTLYGASFCAISPTTLGHRMAKICGAGRLSAECAQRGTSEADIEAGEKLGFDTG